MFHLEREQRPVFPDAEMRHPNSTRRSFQFRVRLPGLQDQLRGTLRIIMYRRQRGGGA
jgi:hypothetical protein